MAAPTQADVHLQLPDGREVLAGTIEQVVVPPRRQSVMTFRYSPEYLADPLAYELSADLPLDSEMHSPQIQLDTFFAFRDVQPDRWGTRLIESAERRAARREGRRPQRLTGLDILLRIPDETRQGALRFSHPGQPIARSVEIAPSGFLPILATVTGRIENEDDLDEDALMLLPSGTGAGGARPKFTIRLESGRLALAKLPSRDDRWDVARWEVATARAATEAGIDIPKIRYVPGSPGSDGVTVVERFDRTPTGDRIGYRSGAGMLSLTDATDYTYADLAAAAMLDSEEKSELGAELFRRIAFTVLVNNADDHARNHGFLRGETDWSLAPSFDVNPHPGILEGTPIDSEDDPADRDLRRLVADRDRYRLSLPQAHSAIRSATLAAERIPEFAKQLGATEAELSRFSEVFNESRFDLARSLASGAVGQPRPIGRQSQGRDRLGRFTGHRRTSPDGF